jgi:hypothetical protein
MLHVVTLGKNKGKIFSHKKNYSYFFQDTKLKPIYHNVTLYIIISIWNIISHPRTAFYIIYVLFSILGHSYSKYFYVFHLFQIVVRSEHLQVNKKISLLLQANRIFFYVKKTRTRNIIFF